MIQDDDRDLVNKFVNRRETLSWWMDLAGISEADDDGCIDTLAIECTVSILSADGRSIYWEKCRP